MTALRAARIDRGLTQAQLAERSGVHRRVIENIEQRRTSPSAENAERLADALDQTVERLFAGAHTYRWHGKPDLGPVTFAALYRREEARLGDRCPVENGFLLRLADGECEHGRLPGDRSLPCGCFPFEEEA